ncbi:MAG: radical SAM protein [Anaerolineales bacterium]
MSSANGAGKYLIYRPLLGMAFVGNQAMARICQELAREETSVESLSPEVKEFLQACAFMQPDPPLPPTPQDQFHPTMAVLLMTNRCQLRCIYCYASAGERPAQTLPLEIGKAAIDVVCANAQAQGLEAFEVTFHGGGEPTLAWKTMKHCAEHARRKSLKAKITLTSNGIWSKSQRAWILANLDGFSLSMDGRAQTQDRHRPFASGRGSFDIVWQNLVELDRRGVEYGIRLTAAQPWEDFPRDIEFLCKETGCKKFQVEPTFHIKRGTHGDPRPGDGQAFVEAFLAAMEIAERAGRELMYAGARLGFVSHTFCTAPFGALIVNGAGQVVSCYELTASDHPMQAISVIGNMQSGQVELDLNVRRRLHNLLAQRREACQDCFCYWSCAGDCYVRALPSPDSAPAYRGERCSINRALTEALLLKRIAEGGGIWRSPRRITDPAILPQAVGKQREA